jgi:transposase-like protein
VIAEFHSLYDLFEAIPDEQAAIDHFRALRWKDGAFCPHCGSAKVYNFSDNRTHKCGDCRQRFSIKVGTIFEDTKIPLRKWFAAIWMLTSHKKGIASTTLAKDIKVTQKTAWFMLHRLRHAASTKSFNAPLAGEVEVDETYVGGKAKNRHLDERGKIGGGHRGKAPVVGAIERNGELVAKAVEVASKPELHSFMAANIDPNAELLVTDAHLAYRNLTGYANHRIVNHHKGEWRRGRAHTNTIESVWALLKRQIIGIHHWVSPKHLDRYVQEMTWRFNRRRMGEGERLNAMIFGSGGRLRYRELIA